MFPRVLKRVLSSANDYLLSVVDIKTFLCWFAVQSATVNIIPCACLLVIPQFLSDRHDTRRNDAVVFGKNAIEQGYTIVAVLTLVFQRTVEGK